MPANGPAEVRVKLAAVGINYLDGCGVPVHQFPLPIITSSDGADTRETEYLLSRSVMRSSYCQGFGVGPVRSVGLSETHCAVTMRSWVKPAMVVLPMTDVYLAPELLESRRVFGKIVLRP